MNKLLIMKGFIVVTTMVMLGCAPAYIPNAVNVPLLSNQGQFSGAVQAGTNGYDLQTSYALTPQLAVMANGSIYSAEGESTGTKQKRSFGEGGLGYYTAFSGSGRLEIFSGYGQGLSSYVDDFDFFGPQKVEVEGRYYRIFLQPSIGTVTSFFDGALSLRACYVNFYQIKNDGVTLDHSVDGMFLEPVLTARLGYKQVKFVTQIGYSLPVGKDVEMLWQPFFFNLGLNFNLGQKEKTAESK